MKKWQKITGNKDRRVHERTTVFIKGAIATDDGEFRVFVRNLSRSGALIDTNEPLHSGIEVSLRCDDLMVPARVAWAHNKRVGLEFTTPIEEEQVAKYMTKRAA